MKIFSYSWFHIMINVSVPAIVDSKRKAYALLRSRFKNYCYEEKNKDQKNTTVDKNYGEFCYKMKNLNLFIQINFIPFKVIPSWYNALMSKFFPIVETVFNKMVTKNECSVRWRIVVMQKPRVVCPKYLLKRCWVIPLKFQ